jgi:hypothetical protein
LHIGNGNLFFEVSISNGESDSGFAVLRRALSLTLCTTAPTLVCSFVPDLRGLHVKLVQPLRHVKKGRTRRELKPSGDSLASEVLFARVAGESVFH